jgi:hypothetical protein
MNHDRGLSRSVVNVARTGVALGELAWISVTRPYRAFWWDKRVNFGDLLTEAVLRWLGARRVVNVRHLPFDCGPALVGAGSVLGMLRYPSGVVWGSGFLWETPQPNQEPPQEPLEVLAYRGPRTRDLAKMLGWKTTDVFGDPGILLSRMFEPERKRWEVGFVPNFSHAHSYRGTESATGVKVIDLERPDVRAVTAELSSCRAIVSTSLHGIVAAQAFGIPWVWCKTEPELSGAEFKFHDFMEGMRISARPVAVSPGEIDEAGLLALAKDARLPDGEDVREKQRQLLCALRESSTLRPPRLLDERIRSIG